MRNVVRATAAALAVSSIACVQVYPPTAPSPQPAAGAPPGAAAPSVRPAPSGAAVDSSKSATSEPFKKWDEVLKDTRAIDGYFKTHLKRDNTLFLELAPSQLDKDFGLMMHVSRGLGEFFLNDGLPLIENTRLMRFRRVGDQIQLVHRNTRFTADAGSPMLASLEENVGNSVVAAFKIQSEGKENGHLLIDLTTLVVSDYGDLTTALRSYYGTQPIRMDRERSNVDAVHGFERNVEIDVDMTIQASSGPRFGGPALADGRTVTLGVRYSLFALPDDPMRPRLADDRVGFFLEAMRDYSRDVGEDYMVRYVTRWRLEKSDHSKAVADAVEPIVYYVDRSIPLEYRRFVKEGIEAWNKAFEAAGISNAIVARDAPDDSLWSAEDMRYSTVRWSTSHALGGAWAIGPSQTDPRTGEILNADVIVSSNWTRFHAYDYDYLAGPQAMRDRLDLESRLSRELPSYLSQRLCMAEMSMADELSFQYSVLLALGELAPGEPMPTEFLGDAIRDLVMHEVGHTLGLRHNFKASSAIPNDRLQDTTFTRKNGVTLSVMDYGIVNVAMDRTGQGDYYNKEVGAYDVWAIQYGYSTIYQQAGTGPLAATGAVAGSPEAELPGLRKIAARSTDPLHAYGTDEDAGLGVWTLDPRSAARDIGSDHVRSARDRIALVDRVLPKLEGYLIDEGEGYQRLRGAFASMISQRLRALQPLVTYVGGVSVSRSHKGDPQAELPFRTIPAAEQRAAVATLLQYAFAENALQFDGDMLNKLAPPRWYDWSGGFITPLDFPVHDWVSLVHEVLLYNLMSGYRFQRMIDNEVRTPRNEVYTVAELFGTLTDAIMAETGFAGGAPRSAHSFRRNLQRIYLNVLAVTLNGRDPSVPEDARSLARFELKRISAQLGTALGTALGTTGLDTVTRAHFDESKERVDRMIEASFVRTIP
ncbi:MAG TPA: zinc-dependent metalloprotease [Gemmatimonadales bacterium]